MRRDAAGWLALAWFGLLAPPWFDGEAGWHPAVQLVFAGGTPWLVPLAAALALATWAGRATGRDASFRPGLFALAGGVGLLWLLIEGLSIGQKGWTEAWLATTFGGVGPSQAAMGWGALAYAVGCLGCVATGLAGRGVCKGDAFVAFALTFTVGTMTVFVFYPVTCVLLSAVRDNDGAFAPALFMGKVFDHSIWSVGCLADAGACGVAWHTVAVAAMVGLFSTLLGLAFALIALRTGFRLKPLVRGLTVLPIITPPFVIGLALILLFGRAGMATTWLSNHLDVPRSRWIYGVWGITIAQVMAFTPIAFMVMSGVLQGVSPSLEEASTTLRATPWRTFRTITFPLLRPGLANAFLIGFIESMADFANPLVIGGNFNVLSTDIFFAVVGAAHDQGRAAVLAIVLLVFTLTAFIAQRFWLGGRGFTTVTGKGDNGIPAPLPGGLRALCYCAALPFLLLTVAVYGIILVGGFVESVGRDNTPTARYLMTAFSVGHGVGGWFLSGSAWASFLTTIELALIAMPPTAALGISTAWLLDRQRFAGRSIFEFMTMMSFAIPGTVIGIAYILAFNVAPIELTGTGTIIVLAFVFRNMPVGIRAGLANLGQIDRSLDEASLTLGANSAGTFARVIAPLLRPAIATAMTYSFVRAVTAVSAVIFLTTGEYSLATVYIVGRADVGEYGIAIVYSAMLIVVMASVLAIIHFGVGQRRLGRRSAAPAGSEAPRSAAIVAAQA